MVTAFYTKSLIILCWVLIKVNHHFMRFVVYSWLYHIIKWLICFTTESSGPFFDEIVWNQISFCIFSAKVETYLQNEQIQAATKIQKVWRGHSERNRLSGRRDLVQQTRAAIKIQHTVRRWLERLDRRKGEMPIHLRPPGLNDERRVQLQKTINNYREENPVCWSLQL